MNRRKFISSTIAATSGLLVSRTNGNAQTTHKSLRSYDREVTALLSRMTLQEKIGQMLQAEQDKLADGDIEKYSIGSVLSGGSSDPKAGNSVEAWTDLYDSLQ